jgi:ethanolamine permease
MAAGIYGLFIAYFIFFSRHHLVKGTPEEEFENIRKAEQEL